MEQIGGYKLESKIGEGGMGAVFRATNPRFPGRTFALKVLQETTDPTSLERFHREMKALSVATTHPNVVRIFGGTVEGERPFYVMELVPGESLSSLAQENPFEPTRAATIVRAVADALAHVHDQGVVHRDLKPANVILEANDNPRILDFGLASMVGEDRLTKTGAFLGTPAYAAPEQLDGRSHEADRRADVYALGGLLHFLLSGKAPFEASSDAELIPRVLLNPATPPSSHEAGVPVELDAVCLKALEKEARDRYATAAEFREELDRFLRGDAVQARVPGRREKFTRWRRRHRREVRIVAAALLLLVGVVTAYLVRKRLRFSDRAMYQKIVDEVLATRDVGTIQEKLKRLDGADDDLRGKAQRRLEECRSASAKMGELRKVLLFDDTVRTADEDTAKLVEATIDAIVWGGNLLELGERMLARRDDVLAAPPADRPAQARSAKLLRDAAERAASARDDREGHALAALVGLADAGAEREPLGRGRLPDAANATLARDLEAASKGTDALAARAAGLLVDLAIESGDAARARAELERRRSTLGEADRATFEKILATKLDPDELARELPAEPAAAVRRAAELARLLALAGAPRAIEHPEVADPSVGLDAIARRDHLRPSTRFWRPSDVDRGLLQLSSRISTALGDLHREEFKEVTVDVTQAVFDRFAVEHEELTRKVLEADPANALGLRRAGYPLRQRLSTGPFLVLSACESLDQSLLVASAFSSFDREIMRSGTMHEYYAEAVWDAPWQNYDASLATSLAEDPLARLVPATRLADAATACGALERLDVLARAADERLSVEPAARRRLALEAVVGLERLRALSPSLAMPFTARLGRFALPAPLGQRLGELELRRVLAYGQDAIVEKSFYSYHLLFCAAFFAAEDPKIRETGLHFDLYDQVVKIVKALSPDPGELSASRNYITIRNVGKQLRDSLENDPKRHDWRKDFGGQ